MCSTECYLVELQHSAKQAIFILAMARPPPPTVDLCPLRELLSQGDTKRLETACTAVQAHIAWFEQRWIGMVRLLVQLPRRRKQGCLPRALPGRVGLF